MHESEAFYEEILYPLQNGVLRTLAACEAPFYLTGGTALHRHFFGFRYSDDLDLFVTGNDRKVWQARRLNIALHRRPGKTWRLFGEFGDGVEPTFR